MINPDVFLKAVLNAEISFITGVPDSLLKDICGYISDNSEKISHKIATNEGSAIAMAIGNYLATKNVPLIYMQNSGLGNIVNPITSLADPQVYGIPMVLMIGWRGEIDTNGNQVKDEPQHKKQGQITISQLEILDIPYLIIDHSTRNINQILKDIVFSAKERNGPIALLVRKNSFEKYSYKKFLGEINGAEKYKLIRNARFLIMPSFCENYGYVALESLSVSTPVIASSNSYWTHLEECSAGFICKPNSESIKMTLDHTASLSNQKILNMRSNAFKLYQKEIKKNEQSIDLYTNFYKSITNA